MDECKTKYPILLLHGAGFRDLKMPLYWGRIPGELKKRGADVFYGQQDCWADVETNAQFLVHRLDEVLRLSGAEKVNIIAHSKGGLEARALASSFGCAGKIASITTLGTPHRGSKAMDAVCGKIPGAAFRLAALAVNKLRGVEPYRFRHADFRSCCVKALDNTTVFPVGFALPEQKSATPKLHSTCSAGNFRGILVF